MSVGDDGGEDGGSFETEARIELFGYAPTQGVLRLRRRPRSWRLGGALRTMGVAVVIAPLVGLVPPHAPWALGALAGGAFLARRRWTERFTVLGVRGTCPRCGAPVDGPVGRLRTPHAVACTACRHEAAAVVPPGGLEEAGGSRT